MKLFAGVGLLIALLSAEAAYCDVVKPLIIITNTPKGPVILPEDNPPLQENAQADEQKSITEALSAIEDGEDAAKLVDLVANTKSLTSYPVELLDRIEISILKWTKPIPATAVDKNLAGYTALVNLRPENSSYSEKLKYYLESKESLRRQVLQKFRTQTSEFDNVRWYVHKNTPKYTDTRSYIELYVGLPAKGAPFLRFKINYTAKSWLFVQSAKANIDGEILPFPTAEWLRDNDSEIWEWVDVNASNQYLEIAKRIAESEKTVIRFDGQQYYDDYTVRKEDKEAILDALLAFDVLSKP